MDLPVTLDQARRVAHWMKAHFAAEMAAAAPTSPIDTDLLCAIACQESAIYWLGWIDKYTPDAVIAHCVFDASGDDPSSPRKQFPRNTAEFRAAYGDAFTQMLIDEANAMRQMRKMAPAQIVYKGYGIFQYDLQFVQDPKQRPFFEQRLWRDFSECARRAAGELGANYARSGSLKRAIHDYNGSGAAADAYANNVLQFLSAIKSDATLHEEAQVNYPGHVVEAGEQDVALVAAIQNELKKQGYGPFGAAFDDRMSATVRLFQSQHVDREGRPLDPDGVIGPLTWTAIFGAGTSPGQVTQGSTKLAQATVDLAHRQVGVMEQPPGSNRGPQVDQYLARVGIAPNQGTADDRYWCMAFAYWCVDESAKALGVANPLVKTASVLDQWNRCANRPGVTRISQAQAKADMTKVEPGQLLILDHGGGTGHTGIVASIDGPHLTVIEGNASNIPNDRNGVGVFQTSYRKISDPIVKGFLAF